MVKFTYSGYGIVAHNLFGSQYVEIWNIGQDVKNDNDEETSDRSSGKVSLY